MLLEVQAQKQRACFLIQNEIKKETVLGYIPKLMALWLNKISQVYKELRSRAVVKGKPCKWRGPVIHG